MGRIFDYDGRIFTILRKIGEVACLSVFWLLSSLPLITMGAATAALYYTVNKVIRQDRGHLWQEYWHAFKSNLKQATVVQLYAMLVYAIGIADCYILYQFALKWDMARIIYVAFLVFLLFLTVWVLYLFPYLARFENATKEILKNCLWMMIGNLPWSILILFILIASIAILIFLPVSFLFVPAAYMWITNLIFERIFRKYMKKEEIKELVEDERWEEK